MNVTLVKYGRTVRRNDSEKCFEFERIDVEAMPLPGQTPDELFAQVQGFVETKLAVVTGKTEAKVPAKKKSDPNTGSGPSTDSSTKTEKPAAKAKPSAKARTVIEKDKRTRLQYALESESLQELHDRLVGLSEINKAFTVEEWQDANSKVAEVYRRMEKSPDKFDLQDAVVDQIKELFKSNKNILEERKRGKEFDAELAA